MNALITARFTSRDEADLALMRLRRSGVRFQLLDLAFAGEGAHRQAAVYNPGGGTMLTQPGTDDPFFPPIGSRALFGLPSSEPVREALLKLSVVRGEEQRARDVLRSAGGRGIVTRS